jgi:hypothetical protein
MCHEQRTGARRGRWRTRSWAQVAWRRLRPQAFAARIQTNPSGAYSRMNPSAAKDQTNPSAVEKPNEPERSGEAKEPERGGKPNEPNRSAAERQTNPSVAECKRTQMRRRTERTQAAVKSKRTRAQRNPSPSMVKPNEPKSTRIFNRLAWAKRSCGAKKPCTGRSRSLRHAGGAMQAPDGLEARTRRCLFSSS